MKNRLFVYTPGCLSILPAACLYSRLLVYTRAGTMGCLFKNRLTTTEMVVVRAVDVMAE